MVALSQCKKLKKIDISSCKFSSIQSLDALPNLTYLNVSDSCVTNKQLIKLTKRSLKLERLYVRYRKNVSNQFIKIISRIKSFQRDNHFLIIFYTCSNIEPKNLDDISCLIYLPY